MGFLEASNAIFESQNGWQPYDTDAWKITEVVKCLDLAAGELTGDGRIHLNFVSRAAGTYVGTAASVINNSILDTLKNHRPGASRTGICALDFVGNTGWQGLEGVIIRRNRFVEGCSFSEISPLSFRLQLEPHGEPWQEQWMVEGDEGRSLAGDAAGAVVFDQYAYGGELFFRVAHGDGRYLSHRNDGQVGLYSDFNKASTFHEQDGALVSHYSGQPMRLRGNQVWCGDDGTLLDVTFAMG